MRNWRWPWDGLIERLELILSYARASSERFTEQFTALTRIHEKVNILLEQGRASTKPFPLISVIVMAERVDLDGKPSGHPITCGATRRFIGKETIEIRPQVAIRNLTIIVLGDIDKLRIWGARVGYDSLFFANGSSPIAFFDQKIEVGTSIAIDCEVFV